MKKSDINATKVKWSRPMCIEDLSKIFNVHRNTMSKWLKAGVIHNRQLSPRRWQIAMFDLPNGLEREKES